MFLQLTDKQAACLGRLLSLAEVALYDKEVLDPEDGALLVTASQVRVQIKDAGLLGKWDSELDEGGMDE